jgi:hypothetical protein
MDGIDAEAWRRMQRELAMLDAALSPEDLAAEKARLMDVVCVGMAQEIIAARDNGQPFPFGDLPREFPIRWPTPEGRGWPSA